MWPIVLITAFQDFFRFCFCFSGGWGYKQFIRFTRYEMWDSVLSVYWYTSRHTRTWWWWWWWDVLHLSYWHILHITYRSFLGVSWLFFPSTAHLMFFTYIIIKTCTCLYLTAVLEVLMVRWAAGKRLTNHLPKLALQHRPPPGTAGYSGPDRIYIRTGRRVTSSRLQLLGAQGQNLSGAWHEENLASSKSVFMVDVRFKLTTSSSSPADDAIC